MLTNFELTNSQCPGASVPSFPFPVATASKRAIFHPSSNIQFSDNHKHDVEEPRLNSLDKHDEKLLFEVVKRNLIMYNRPFLDAV